MMDLGDFTWEGMVESIARKSSGKLVRDVMSKIVITVDEDASLMECVDHMIKHNIKRLPVVDKSGKVIGMLYERDVFFAITKAMLNENNGGVK
jgi:predicted transcriptional regulator